MGTGWNAAAVTTNNGLGWVRTGKLTSKGA